MDVPTLKGYATAVSVFLQRNKRWPSELSGDPDEIRLAIWLEECRKDLLNGTMGCRETLVLSSLIPGWRMSGEQKWLRQARALSDLVLLLGPGALASSPTLAAWTSGQLELLALSSLDAQRSAWLDDHVPGWRTLQAVCRTPARKS